MRRGTIVGLALAALTACGTAVDDASDAAVAGSHEEFEAPGEVPADHPWPTRARVPFLALDGLWDFAPDPQDSGLAAGWSEGDGEAAPFAARIRVPLPPEATGAFLEGGPMPSGTARVLWYRTRFQIDGGWDSRRVAAIFLGVDGHATVWLNGHQVGEHDGGYTPFEVDLTDALVEGSNTVIVRTADPDPSDPAALVGAQPEIGNISGIWRSVFVEARGARWSGPIGVEPTVTEDGAGFRLRVPLKGDATAADRVELALAFPDGSIAGITRPLTGDPLVRLDWCCTTATWSPEAPNLIRAALRLTRDARLVDEQRFSFGLREVGVGWCPGGSPDDLAGAPDDAPAPFGCVTVNGAPRFLRAASYDASDAAHGGSCPDGTCDVELQSLRAWGFDTVRVRGTTLPPRVLAEADRLGLLVLADLPGFAVHAANPLATGGAEALEAELDELLPTGAVHPSIIGWTLFQEEAGLLHPPFWHDPALTDWLASLVHRARTLAPQALVEDNVAGGFSRLLDGSQPHLQTDLQSYAWPPGTLTETATWLDDLASHAVPGSAWSFVGATPQQGQPILVADASCRSGNQAGGPLAGCLPELLTLLRGQPRLAGFSLGPWRDRGTRAGLVDASGAAKEWGYGTYGLTLGDLLRDDFVLLETPLVRRAEPATEVTLPLGVAAARGGPRDGWRLHVEAFLDTCTVLGKPVREALWKRDLPLPSIVAFGANPVADLVLTTPEESGVVTVRADLVNAAGRTMAANRLQLVVPGACRRAPADEAPPDEAVPLGSAWGGQWSQGAAWGSSPAGYGIGRFTWDLYLPEGFQQQQADRFAVVFEAAPAPTTRPVPQTDAQKTSTRAWCRLQPEGAKTWFSLSDAYADARGVLSGLNAPDQAWASGDLVRLDIPARDAGEPWQGVIRLECGVDADDTYANGLHLFDETTGRWPLRPTLFAWKKR